MSEHNAEVEHVEAENQPDEYADAIAEAQARFDRAEIETLQQQYGINDRSTGQGNETTENSAGRSMERGKVGGVGYDKVLKEVEEKLGPEYANAVRKVQQDYSRAQGRNAKLNTRLSALEQSLEEIRGGYNQQYEQPIDPNLARITPQQWDIFDKMAASRGYVRREELEAAQAEVLTKEYFRHEMEDARQMFGEQLAVQGEDGEFVLTDEAAEQIQAVHDRIFDPRYGVTPKDLFILANFNEMLEAARQDGVRTSGRQPAPRLSGPRRPMQTVRNSASSYPVRQQLYKSGDSLEDVVRRAAASAMRGA